MRVKHPYALDDDAPNPDGTVHWGARRRVAEVDADGTFEVPDGEEHSLDEWAAGYGYALDDLLVNGAQADLSGANQEPTAGSDSDGDDHNDDVSGTCEAVKADDEVCGRELPCPYHSEA